MAAADDKITNPVSAIDYPGIAGKDGQTGSIGVLVQAPYINMFIAGPAHTVFVSHCTSLRVQTTIESFELVPVIGSFRREPKMGNRLMTATVTRYRPRGRNFEQLVKHAYAMSDGVDIRGDVLPITVQMTYNQPRATFDYSKPLIDTIVWIYGEMYFPTIDKGIATAASSLSEETITLIGQQEVITEAGGMNTVSLPTQIDFAAV